MKILQVIPNLVDGGAERFVVDLSNQLCKDHTVILLTMFDRADSEFFYDSLDSRICVKSIGKKSGFDIRMFWRLHRIIVKEQPDVVHSHLRALNYLFFSILLRGRHVIYTHTIHNMADKEAGKWSRKIRRLLIQNRLLHPVTISVEADLSYEHVYALNERTLIPNGRSLPLKSKLFLDAKKKINSIRESIPTSKVFVNIGSIKPQKNHKCIVDVFSKLDNRFQLLIIGGSREYPDLLNSLIASKSDNIHFLGSLVNATDYLHLCDAFCLSSLYEGAPISLIEAMALGCIPICTPVGGIPSMYTDGKEGIISRSTSVEDYNNAILRFDSMDKETLKSFSENISIKYRKLFSIEACAQKYLELWKA